MAPRKQAARSRERVQGRVEKQGETVGKKKYNKCNEDRMKGVIVEYRQIVMAGTRSQLCFLAGHEVFLSPPSKDG